MDRSGFHMRMLKFTGCFLALTAFSASAGFAEQWEIGAAGAWRFARNVSVSRGNASADAGFGSGGAFSVFAGQQWISRLGGEFRYTFSDADPRVQSGSSQIKSSGQSHSIHYDALVYLKVRESRVRPFIAFGAGLRYFSGTGREVEFQGLDRFAVVTRTSELKPLASVGAGLRYKISEHVALRLDFRDYITPFPTKVVAPAAGASLRGWLHDLSPMVGISAVF